MTIRTLIRFVYAFFMLVAIAVGQMAWGQDVAISQDIAGRWQGKLNVNGVEMRIIIDLEKSEAGEFSATMSSPDQATNEIPVSKVQADGKTFTLEVAKIGGKYKGEFDEDFNHLKGTWSQGGGSLPLNLTHERAMKAIDQSTDKTENAPNVKKLAGIWEGVLNVGGTLRLVFHLDVDADGTIKAKMDSPDQGAQGIMVSKATFTGDKIRLEVAAIGGYYEGKVNADFSEIKGSWHQGGQQIPLVLSPVEKASKLHRPQHPKAPYPYYQDDVTYNNDSAGIHIAGTFTRPDRDGQFPAVLLISGSGPQDRDETLLGHRPFLVLADHLTRAGVAVLRVDDRGVGESSGDFSSATSEDFASDVLAGIAYLKSREDVQHKQIGLIGHSEGGLIAPMVAAQSDDVAFIVLMAGPGVNGEEILFLQTALIQKANGASEDLIAFDRKLSTFIYHTVKTTPDNALAKSQILDYIAAEWNEMPAVLKSEYDKAGVTQAQIETNINAVMTPWFRFFLRYEPADALQNVRCPVLAINGEKDLQVPPKENLNAIGEALKSGENTAYTLKELPGLNHLFQTCESGAPSEYGSIEETFAPLALAEISNWIYEQVGRQ